MGIYINPEEGTKEEWVEKHSDESIPDYVNSFPVVLVDNGAFTAAAVANDEKELKRFIHPLDPRPMKIYVISYGDLTKVLDESELKYLRE